MFLSACGNPSSTDLALASRFMPAHLLAAGQIFKFQITHRRTVQKFLLKCLRHHCHGFFFHPFCRIFADTFCHFCDNSREKKILIFLLKSRRRWIFGANMFVYLFNNWHTRLISSIELEMLSRISINRKFKYNELSETERWGTNMSCISLHMVRACNWLDG